MSLKEASRSGAAPLVQAEALPALFRTRFVFALIQ